MTPNQTDPMYSEFGKLRAELTETLEVALDAYDRGRNERANFVLLTVIARALLEIAVALKTIEQLDKTI